MFELLKKHKIKIIIAVAVVAVLTAAFFLGDDTSSSKTYESSEISKEVSIKESTEITDEKSKPKDFESSVETFEKSETSYKSSSQIAEVSQNQSSEIQSSYEEESISVSETEINENTDIYVSEEESKNEISVIESSENSVNSIDISQESIQDKEQLTCTISISCSATLDNADKLDKSKQSLVPSDGYILKETKTEYSEGESVFDVLKRICTENKIHLEFSKTPAYNSVYIEGINNIYEFDCGSMSGWTYEVNGKFYNYGCSEYILNDGDKIEWIYTCG